MKLDYEHIDEQLSFIEDQLFNRIVELAKVVVLSDEDIHGFCMGMGMGSASFSVTIHHEEDGYVWETEDEADPCEMPDQTEEVQELDYILGEYNGMFKLTGGAVKIEKLLSGELSVVFDWAGKGIRGEPRRSPRNNIIFETYPPGSSVEDYGQIVDSLYEMARDVADANGIGYPEALQDVREDMAETYGWVLLPTERERILERLNIQ